MTEQSFPPEAWPETAPQSTAESSVPDAAPTAKPSSPPDISAADIAAPTTQTPQGVNGVDIWDPVGPIESRITQLKTRHSLLEEKIQKLRPTFPARGKKK